MYKEYNCAYNVCMHGKYQMTVWEKPLRNTYFPVDFSGSSVFLATLYFFGTAVKFE